MSITNPNDPKSQSAFIDYKGKLGNKQKTAWKKKFSIGSLGPQEPESSDLKKFNNSSPENEKLKSTKILEDLSNLEFTGTIDDRIIRHLFAKPVHHKFYLSVREAKVHEHRVGYIFKFEPPANKNLESKVSTLKKMDLTILNNKDIQDFEKSDLSVVSFAGAEKKRNSLQPSPENPFGINAEGGDEFFKKICTEKENQFTLDLNDMSYKQFGDGNVENKLYDKLRKEAIEKINKTNQQIRDEEQEEEESSSSSDSYESIEEENLSDSELSSKKKNDDISSKDSKDVSFNQQEKENKVNNNKNNFLSKIV